MNANAYPITKINLKLLQTFVLVAEHERFRQAADETRRSQSAISSQIKQLETQLGLSLFHRTTRRVRLTADGEQLLRSATRALEEVGLGLQKIFEAADRRRGSITLACLPTFAATQLASILSSFEMEYPEVRVYVRELHTADLLTCVRNNEVDFGVCTDNQDVEFHFDPIFDDVFYAIVPRKFSGDATETITLQKLASLPLLLLNPTCVIGSTLETALRANNLQVNTKYQFTQVQTVISMAEAALGVAVLPQSALPHVPRGSVRFLRVTEPEIVRRISVVRLPGQKLSQSAMCLAQLIRQQVRSHGSREVFRPRLPASATGLKKAPAGTDSQIVAGHL